MLRLKVYRVSGTFLMGRKRQPFTKEIVSEEGRVEEKVYSDIGGRHRCKRRDIRIEEIKEISKDEITNPFVKQLLEMGEK